MWTLLAAYWLVCAGLTVLVTFPDVKKDPRASAVSFFLVFLVCLAVGGIATPFRVWHKLTSYPKS